MNPETEKLDTANPAEARKLYPELLSRADWPEPGDDALLTRTLAALGKTRGDHERDMNILAAFRQQQTTAETLPGIRQALTGAGQTLQAAFDRQKIRSREVMVKVTAARDARDRANAALAHAMTERSQVIPQLERDVRDAARARDDLADEQRTAAWTGEQLPKKRDELIRSGILPPEDDPPTAPGTASRSSSASTAPNPEKGPL